MPFISLKGIKGKIFIPDEHATFRKNPCKDCYYCQFCSDEKCGLCIKMKVVDYKSENKCSDK